MRSFYMPQPTAPTERTYYMAPPPGVIHRPWLSSGTVGGVERTDAYSQCIGNGSWQHQPESFSHHPSGASYTNLRYSDRLAKADPVRIRAMAEWYVDQVIGLLSQPGQYRAGFGGSDAYAWGRNMLISQSMARVGRLAEAQAWARPFMPRVDRQLEKELHDPYGIAWWYSENTREPLVQFVIDLIIRMSISSESVVAGVWFIQGLALHMGDGAQGEALRMFLKTPVIGERDASLKRVCVLGLLLAGMSLDDNPFHLKSWNEVTGISIGDLGIMERLALYQYLHCLTLPREEWVAHLDKHCHHFFSRASMMSRQDGVVLAELDHLRMEYCEQLRKEDERFRADHAMRAAVLTWPSEDPQPIAVEKHHLHESHPLNPGMLGQTQQHLNDEFHFVDERQHTSGWRWTAYQWNQDVRSYSMNNLSEACPSPIEVDSALAAERTVAALVDDDFMDTDDAESQFLEYDGARPFYPTAYERQQYEAIHGSHGAQAATAWQAAFDEGDQGAPSAFDLHRSESNTSLLSDYIFAPLQDSFGSHDLQRSTSNESNVTAISQGILTTWRGQSGLGRFGEPAETGHPYSNTLEVTATASLCFDFNPENEFYPLSDERRIMEISEYPTPFKRLLGPQPPDTLHAIPDSYPGSPLTQRVFEHGAPASLLEHGIPCIGNQHGHDARGPDGKVPRQDPSLGYQQY